MVQLTIQQAFDLALQHHQAGRLPEAERLYRQILAKQPDHAQGMHYLGVIAHQVGQNDVAVDLIQRALALGPNWPQAHYNLGLAMQGGGQLKGAIAAYRRAIELDPNRWEAYYNLSKALRDIGEISQAVAVCRQAILIEPGNADAHCNLGAALQDSGELDESISVFRRAIALKPIFPEAFNNLGDALIDKGCLDEAVAILSHATVLRPDFPEAHNNLGHAFKERGQLDEAIASYRRAVSLRPSYIEADDNLVYTLSFHPAYDAKAIYHEACRWNEQHASRFARQIPPWPNVPDPSRPLRIGYVSPNFRQHTNGLALLPLFEAHDQSSFQIVCYSDVERPDAITEKCGRAVHEWRSILGLSDQQVADLVRSDRIDILVDLVCHMGRNRLLVFARKPAPVQVTFLGHQGTTGLTTMDYRISDPHVDPPGAGDADYTEKIVRLPECYLCFRPIPDSPSVSELPALQAGHITFGSLNNFCKVTPSVLESWSRILAELPESRLILRCPPGESHQRVLDFFANRGVDPARVNVCSRWMGVQAYLELHQGIDIYLDTFPHSGHTTSMDALWMGVPLITLAGRTAVGHGGVFLLANLGLENLIANTVEEYVEKAVSLARDTPRLAELRVALRPRMEQSPLMDAPSYARNVEALFREMWRKWCDGSAVGANKTTEVQHGASPLKPSSAQDLNDLGKSLKAKGQLNEAIGVFRQAIAVDPKLAEAHSNLGNALTDSGKIDEALAAHRIAVNLRPDDPKMLYNFANALARAGQLDEAITAYEQSIALAPDTVEAHSNLGDALAQRGYLDRAFAAYRRAIALAPDLPEPCNNLGVAYREAGRPDDAQPFLQRAISLRPGYAEAHSNLGNVFKDQGRLDEAIACYRRAMSISPGAAKAHSNLALISLYHPRYDREAIVEELRRWNRQHAEPLRQFILPHSNDPSPSRRLRIGYVSPDFRQHPVGRNLLPLFRHHDRTRYEITCYAQVSCADTTTGELRQLSDRWRRIVGMTNEQVAEQIREDGIDILVDLALHSANNRLLLFARKPAPVQVTFAGYPGSTGLDSIDYRLSDPFLDAPGTDESTYSEKTVRLSDSFWCYDPLDCHDITVNSLPALKSEGVTFGCLNNFCKINADVLELWGRVLRQLEGSRLVLLAAEGAQRKWVLEQFDKGGIAPARIDFMPFQTRREYLETYHRIDVGLDTYPYNGHTTSLDSLWMGVPVVTLVGPTAVSRAGWSQLSNLGLNAMAAQTPDEFVEIAVSLGRDLPRLSQLRATLRERMRQSPLMDAAKFARSIEDAYRAMWLVWCAKRSADR